MSFDLIAGSTLAADAASFDFVGIPATYRHLFMLARLRSTTAALTTALNLRVNNDSGANYDVQTLVGLAGAASAGEGFAATECGVDTMPAATAAATLAGTTEILIPDYTNTTWDTDILTFSYRKTGTVGSSLRVTQRGFSYRSALSVSRLTVFPGAGNLLAGSSCYLYGIV